jgi:hypothetical protein
LEWQAPCKGEGQGPAAGGSGRDRHLRGRGPRLLLLLPGAARARPAMEPGRGGRRATLTTGAEAGDTNHWRGGGRH